jgi:hypothetical protein
MSAPAVSGSQRSPRISIRGRSRVPQGRHKPGELVYFSRAYGAVPSSPLVPAREPAAAIAMVHPGRRRGLTSSLDGLSRCGLNRWLSTELTAESRQLAFAQLLLPPQHPRLRPFRLRLGNHPFFLIQHRQTGVRQDVVRIDLRQPLRHRDRVVVALEIL